MSVAAASYFPLSLAELDFQNQLFLGMVSLPLLFCLCFICCLPYRAAFRSKPCTCNEGRTGYGTLAIYPCTSPTNSFVVSVLPSPSPSTSFSSRSSSGRASPSSPQLSRSVLVNIVHPKSMLGVANKEKGADTMCDIEVMLEID